MSQSEWVQLSNLVKNVPKQQRGRAWELMKSDGFQAASDYVQGLIDAQTAMFNSDKLLEVGLTYPVWGAGNIETGAIKQMDMAMRLPISVAGALMPDAHQGYGLPIGGVLATDARWIIPYAVGVDIACRMRLSVFELVGDMVDRLGGWLAELLVKNTVFGSGQDGMHDGKLDHEVLDADNWQSTPLLKSLRQTAIYQLGTSGGGNHFVDWCVIEAVDGSDPNAVTPGKGKWLALMSHSGSRGVGARIADHYSRLAEAQHPHLEANAAHLSWLSMEKGEGAEYWEAMHLAGLFASANHQIIHERIYHELGLKPFAVIENHHNFAWREQINGVDVNVHRKGATPAGKNVYGVIPGTMATPGFVVLGLGNEASLNSASHGSGRAMSRTQAKKNLDPAEMKKFLKEQGVTLIGGGLDEAPLAYKDSLEVMAAQSDLVRPLAQLMPRIVRMADDSRPFRPAPAGIAEGSKD